MTQFSPDGAADDVILASINRFAELLSVTPDYAFTTDVDGVVLWANPAFTALLGQTVRGQNITAFYPGWVRSLMEREARPVAQRDGHWVGRTALAPSGQPERSILQILVAHRNDAGIVEGYSGLLRDLTEAEKFAEHCRLLAETFPVGIFQNDSDGRCVWVNATYATLTGWPVEEALGYGWMQALAPESRELLQQVKAAMDSGKVFGPHDVDFIRRDGSRRTVSVRVAPLVAPDGTMTGQVGVVADITQRRAEQHSVEVAEQLLRTVLNSVQEAIVVQDESVAVQLWNPAAERILGLTADELRGVTPTSRQWRAVNSEGQPLPDDQHPAVVALRTGQAVTGFILGVHKPDGTLVWLRVSSQLTTLQGGSSQRGVVTTFVDITAEREAEQQLLRNARQLQTITAAARDAICLHDADGTYTWISEGASEVLGWPTEALIGRNPYELFHPDDVERIRRESHEPILAGSRPLSLTYRFRRADGSYTWVETETAMVPATDTVPMRLVTTSRSVDVRMESDARNQVRQQLGGVALFAGRLAHDFTNLNTVARARLEMVRERISDELREDVDAAVEAIERATGLTRELRALSGSDQLHSEGVDFASLVAELGAELAHTVPERVRLEVKAPPPGVQMLVDRSLLSEVLHAVVENSVDSMANGGVLQFSAEVTQLSHVHIDVHGEVNAGTWALLRVLDEGTGIPEDQLAKVFVPGLSQKGQAVETGLGLPVALARMRQMGGHISISNRTEGGTEVTLWLPVATAPLANPDTDSPAPTVNEAAPHGRAVHVLLVDDDEMVLRTAERLIQRAGYQVTAVASGYDALSALAACDARGDTVDIILTDVIMPGLSGPQFVEKLRQTGDMRPVVYMSGYTGDALPGAARPTAGAVLVSKPFSGAAVIAALQSALSAASAT